MRAQLISASLLVLCFLMALCAVSPAQAQDIALAVSEPKGPPLASGSLYVLNYSCKSKKPTNARNTSVQDLFASFGSALSPLSQTSETFGFYIYKGDAPTASAPATFGTAAGDILGVEHVYTRDAKRSSTTFVNTGCAGQFIIKGADTPNVMGYLASSKNSDKELWAGVATLISGSMGPLSSLLGGEIPGAVTTAASNGATLFNNYLTFLKILDNTKSASHVVRLRTGHLTFATAYASVDIDITPVESLLLGKGVKFRDSLSTILQQQTGLTISGDILTDDVKLVDKCNAIANAWLGAGITSPIDLAYVMVQQILPSSPNKHQIVQCLGVERSQAALDYLHLFRMVKEMRYTQADVLTISGDRTVNATYGQQPQGWSYLGQTALMLIRQGNRYGAGVVLASNDLDALNDQFAETVTVRDDTTFYTLRSRIAGGTSSSVWTGSAADMLAKLSQGVKRWGCYVETDKSIALRTDHHDALVLVAFIEDGQKYTPVTVHVLFTPERKIAELLFADDLDVQKVIVASGCTAPTPAPIVTSASAPNT